MKIVRPTEDRLITTAAAVTTALAAPSQGSTELCNWRVRMEPGTAGPLHAIDREQLWTVLAGSLTITCDGATDQAAAGETVILPAGVQRQITAGDEPADILVCMAVGGMASVPGDSSPVPLPWAR
ncbi:MAG: cupin domain-containing protein [Hamadaea sp.]|uniref:cupin domain-containing protein n=1 Tax=Hamadaea sp. TaxID=2024425 RepID=UPI0017B09ED1|nr:cupin domain-containing protein [Hamadaea sp.]NUR71797.1 cupin domain-containing protein [Hamadaea sp.]NUT23675.1 cupin domain-containing protein [Hamadaea sp.]